MRRLVRFILNRRSLHLKVPNTTALPQFEYQLLGCLRAWVIVIKKERKKEKLEKRRRKGYSIIEYIRKFSLDVSGSNY